MYAVLINEMRFMWPLYLHTGLRWGLGVMRIVFVTEMLVIYEVTYRYDCAN